MEGNDGMDMDMGIWYSTIWLFYVLLCVCVVYMTMTMTMIDECRRQHVM